MIYQTSQQAQQAQQQMLSPKTNNKQLTVPRITKTRSKKRTTNKDKDTKSSPNDNNNNTSTNTNTDSTDNKNQDGSRSSDRSGLCGSGADEGEASQAPGKEGSGSTSGDEDRVSLGGGSGAQQRTAKEKAQIRRAQVRRAQIQHRKRKADYMRQLELDIDMLRDLITNAEQDMRTIQKDNEAIRVQLGVVKMVQNDRGVNAGTGVVAVAGGVGGVGGGGGQGGGPGDIDARMTDVPQVSITPAPPVQTNAVPTVDNMAASFSPLSISTETSPFQSTMATSPGGTVSSGMGSIDGLEGLDYNSNNTNPPSLFDGIDLDDISVSIVMDEAIGNPVYQIASLTPNAATLSTSSPDFADPLSPGSISTFPTTPISPLDPGFIPNFHTDLAATPLTTSTVAGSGTNQLSATAYILPNLTVAQTHQVVNFVLALEHVCWGHAGHGYHEPDAEICADSGHALMATNLFLREAPEGIFSSIETSAKDMTAFITNTDPANPEATAQHMQAHQASQGLTWQAPDITLQTLYGLAVSLNPISEMELAPVQAWFELAARYPLPILLRKDVLNALKREFVGVVRCLYFGAVMERVAFESVVQRVVEPVMLAEEKAMATGMPGLLTQQHPVITVSPNDLTLNATATQATDFATDFATAPEAAGVR
ncbi:hypothetical protein SBRCBS47491_005382 [Sporothrix bragantina]|uniref:BZIP domain-containing protein n=1 Tax=Sporothrix bragantina TaxID=671064 RepID=A0ABP0BWD2_9PEZI